MGIENMKDGAELHFGRTPLGEGEALRLDGGHPTSGEGCPQHGPWAGH